MRIACVLVHHFAVQIERARGNGTGSQPLIIGGFPAERKLVRDASPEAMACGVSAGMPLSQAAVLCPEAKFLPLDEGRYLKAAEELAAVLDRFSPAVETDGPECAWLDITGCGDEAGLARELLAALERRTKLRACCGIAGNKFVARTAAGSTRAESPLVVAPGGEADFVAPLSIHFLPGLEDVKERLFFLGMHHIGQVAGISRELLEAQFGQEGWVLYRLAHGIDDAPLRPRGRPRRATAARSFDSPLGTLGELLPVVEKMVARLAPGLREEWQVCRRVSVRLTLADDVVVEKALVMKQPTGAAETIRLRLKSWLEQESLPGPVSGIELALEVTGDSGAQPGLWSRRSAREFDSLSEALEARFGYQPLKKAVMVDAEALLAEDRFRFVDIK